MTRTDQSSLQSNDRKILLVLFTVYCFGAAGLAFFAKSGFYPKYLPDEAQYCLIGENLFRHGIFSLRGDFPSMVPPLYPMIVALSHVLPFGMDVHSKLFLFNCLLMPAVLFPAYGLARLFDIDRLDSCLIATAAMVMPDVLFITMYMSEVIYYPLFISFCYIACEYFKKQTFRTTVFVGIDLGLLLLAKASATVLLLSWLAANFLVLLILLAGKNNEQRDRVEILKKYLLLPLAAAGIALAVYSPWVIIKLHHLGFSVHNLIGRYSENIQSSDRFGILLKWWPIYLSDLFLLSGIVAILPFSLGMRSLWRGSISERNQALFVAVLIIGISAVAASFSGGNSGELRERHMFMLIPLIFVIAAKGVERLEKNSKIFLILASLGLSSFLALILSGYDFHIYPLVNVPWVYSIAHLDNNFLDWKKEVFSASLIWLVIGFQLIWLFRSSKWRRRAFLIGSIFLYIYCTTTAFGALAKWNKIEEAHRGALGQWLVKRIGPGRSLLITGSRSYFQPSIRDEKADPSLDRWSRAFGLSELVVSSLEVDGLYDVRMIPRLDLLKKYALESHAGYVLSTAEILGLPLLGHFRSVNLYGVPGNVLQGSGDLAVKYRTFFDAREFKGKTGKPVYDSSFKEWERVGDKYGFLAYGPDVPVPDGKYLLHFCVRPLTHSRITLDALNNKTGIVWPHRTVDLIDPGKVNIPLNLEAEDGGTYQFRTFVEKGGVAFCGVSIDKATGDSLGSGEGFARPFEVAAEGGWYTVEPWGRWAKGAVSSVIIHAPEPSHIRLTFRAGAFVEPAVIKVYAGKSLLKTVDVAVKRWNNYTPTEVDLKFSVPAGRTIVRIVGPDEFFIPKKLGAWNDTRKLRLGFSDMKVNGIRLF